jgi:flagellar protein FliT
MNSSELIATYEAILQVTTQMLDAARAGDWDRLVDRERECRRLVDCVATTKAEIRLEPEARQRKVEIIRKVLADDAEIRNLAEPCMARLQHLIGSARQERDLHAAYGAGGPA